MICNRRIYSLTLFRWCTTLWQQRLHSDIIPKTAIQPIFYRWLLFCAILLGIYPSLFSQATADTLLSRIENCAATGAVADELGAGFQANPKGEFLLAPPSRDLRFGILIYNIDILSTKAVFSAAIAFRESHSNQLVAFKADNVFFSKTNGLTGPVNLYLLQDVFFRLGNVVKINLNGGNMAGCYATMECKGLKEFGISGSAEFNSQYILPCTDSGEIIKNKVMKTDFLLKAKNWGDILVQVSLPSFQIKSLTDFVFKIQGATLDLSETNNINGLLLPTEYIQDNLLGGSVEIWEGFYLQKGTLTFPKHFKENMGNRIIAGVSNLFIDEFGMSGNIFVQNILNFEKGRIAGWNISIQEAYLNLVFNSIKGGGLKGDLGLPILPDTSRLSYLANIGANDNYLFSIGINKPLTIPALKVAKLNLNQGSYVSAVIAKGEIEMRASLTGSLTIASQKTNENFNFPKVTFQNLYVSNKSPKFGVEYLGIERSKDTASFSKFPLTLNKIALVSKESLFTLQFSFGLNLTEYITAGAGMEIRCEWKNINGSNRLQYKDFAVNHISAAFEKSGVKVTGVIDIFKEDLNYGNGFNGQVSFAIDNIKIKGNAKALFGNINQTRYWYFDAGLTWPAPGIPVFAGVNINGFVGGAWDRMRVKKNSDIVANPNIGKTELGPIFIPDRNAGIGLRAGAFLNGGSETSYEAKTIFEIQCAKSGTIQNILFYGDIEVMAETTPVNKSAIINNSAITPNDGSAWSAYVNSYTPKGKIGGPFMLKFDFDNKYFSANAAIYINNIVGNNIQGSGTNGKAGEINTFFSNKKWYIRVGVPLSPLVIKLKISNQTNISCGIYFNCGTELLPSAPAPNEVIQALHYSPQMDAIRNLEALSTGAGFAFGARFDATATAGATDKKFSVYANLKVIAASDLNLMKFKDNAICASTGEKPGIQNWYAYGSLYTFIQGKVGARAGNFAIDVFTLTGALALDAHGPNPFYANGNMRIEFNLGGFWKFNNNIHIDLGNKCDLRTALLSDTSIIYKITPLNKTKDYNPLDAVSIDFSAPINIPFYSPNGSKYKFVSKSPILSVNGKTTSSNWIWDKDNQRISTNNRDPFPEKQLIKISVSVDLVEIVGNIEKPVYINSKPVSETAVSEFVTGKYPDNISISNVKYAWPEMLNVNFHPKELPNGFIQLKVNQNYLFTTSGTKSIARYTDVKNNTIEETNALYYDGRIGFSAPTLLIAGNYYKINIVHVSSTYALYSGPPSMGGASPIGAVIPSATVLGGRSGTVTSTIKPTILISYWFRCSEFNSNKLKNTDFKQTNAHLSPTSGKLSNLVLEFTNSKNEYFANTELMPDSSIVARIKITADANATNWVKSELLNKIYKTSGTCLPFNFLGRDTNIYGAIPTKAIKIYQPQYASAVLNNIDILSGKNFIFKDKYLEIKYDLPSIAENDLEAIKTKIIALLISGKITTIDATNYAKSFVSSAPKGITTLSTSSTSIVPTMSPPLGASSVIVSLPIAIASTAVPSYTVTLMQRIQNLEIDPLPKPGNFGIQVQYYLPSLIKPSSDFKTTYTVK